MSLTHATCISKTSSSLSVAPVRDFWLKSPNSSSVNLPLPTSWKPLTQSIGCWRSPLNMTSPLQFKSFASRLRPSIFHLIRAVFFRRHSCVIYFFITCTIHHTGSQATHFSWGFASDGATRRLLGHRVRPKRWARARGPSRSWHRRLETAQTTRPAEGGEIRSRWQEISARVSSWSWWKHSWIRHSCIKTQLHKMIFDNSRLYLFFCIWL